MAFATIVNLNNTAANASRVPNHAQRKNIELNDLSATTNLTELNTKVTVTVRGPLDSIGSFIDRIFNP